jgi:hypothetical protein
MIADPLLQGVESSGLDPAGADPAQLFRPGQPAFFEDLEVLRHRGERNAQRRGQGRHRHRTLAQPVEHRPPRGVPQGVKQAVDIDF